MEEITKKEQIEYYQACLYGLLKALKSVEKSKTISCSVSPIEDVNHVIFWLERNDTYILKKLVQQELIELKRKIKQMKKRGLWK
jgi:hypothetical protein